MSTTWFKDENFWRDLYPYMFDAKRLARTPDEVTGIIQLLGLKTTDKIIDFGCGTGRHLLELARRGYDQSRGIDSAAYYISMAKEDAAKEYLAPYFEIKDMLSAPEPGKYTVAFSLFSSFGYFDKHEDNMLTLRNMHATLERGGKLLIDLRGKENFAFNFDSQSWGKTSKGFILTQRTASDDFSKIENSWVVIEDGKAREYTFTHWIYSAQELKAMLYEVGFSNPHVYGDWAGGPYSPQSKRLIMVATRVDNF